MVLTPTEQLICKAIQQDIPLALRPFRKIAEATGEPESRIIAAIERLMHSGVIRKFGAVLIHQKAGFRENALVMWAVPRNQCEETGRILAGFKGVTHCYERDPAFEGKYTVFSMVHFRTALEQSALERMSRATGISDFKVLRSEQEFKKTSMVYF